MSYALSAFSASKTKLNLIKPVTQADLILKRFDPSAGSAPPDGEEKSSTATIAAVVALGALGLYFMQRSR